MISQSLALSVLTAFALALAMGGCAQQDTKAATATSVTAADYQSALANAKTAQQEAAKVGGEWRDTGKLIRAAERAAAEGDYAKAKGLAEKAFAQGRLGREQAENQIDVGNPGYLYR